MAKTIIPAILTDSLSDFKKKLNKIKGLADWLHIDIMDGKFVPNKSLSLRNLRKIKIPLKIEVHLMVENPERYFADCQKLGAKRVIWHIEGTKNTGKVLNAIKKYNFQKGIALKIETRLKKIKPHLRKIDIVLLFAGALGFQGRGFFHLSILKKIRELRRISRKIKIEVDGGLNASNIQKIAKAGADNLVVGSYLVKAKNIRRNFQLLQRALTK